MSGDSTGLVPLPLYISNRMPGFAGLALGNIASGLSPGAGSWPTANLAIYMPFILPAPYVVRRLGWMNGTVTASHIDVGIYSDTGTRIVNTGSVTQSGASALQSFSLATPLKIPAGHYYFAFQCDLAVATPQFQRIAVTAIAGRLMGCLNQAVGSFGLPAVMTPAQYATIFYPLVWMSDHASF